MTHVTTDGDTKSGKAKKTASRKRKSSRMAPATNGEILVRGVAMGILISGITHAGKSIAGALVKHPLSLFSTGLITGYLTHKYRKDIIAVAARTAVESQNVVLREKERLGDWVAEIRAEGQDARQ